MKFVIPVRTISEANSHQHWRVRARRARLQREATALVLSTLPKHQVPCVVTITRVSPGTLDSDNLPTSAKHCRDQIAKWLGVDDKHEHIVRYAYQQRRVPGVHQLEVSIEPMGVES